MNKNIEETIKSILSRVPPSSGDDLTGMLTDIEYYLYQNSNFVSVSVDATDDPICLVKASIAISDDTPSLQTVSEALLEAWTSICYRNFQAASLFMCREATILRFVTVISGDAFCVTGLFSASGPKCSKLVQDFEKDYSRLSGRLGSTSELGYGTDFGTTNNQRLRRIVAKSSLPQ